jgi:hypothetical protein
MQCTFCRLQLDELIRRVHLRVEDCGDLRIPRNSNSIESVEALQARYFSFFKIHSPVPSRRPSLIRLWWFVYGTVDIHLRILVLSSYSVSQGRKILGG